MTQVAERPRAGTLQRGQSLAQSLRKLSEYQLPSKQSERESVFRRFEEEEKAKLEGSGGEPRESEKTRLRPQSLYIGPGGSYGPAVGDQEPDSDEDIVGLSEEERAVRAQKRKNREKQRKAVLAEIVTTEKAYVDNLSILMRHFYQPLVDAANEAGRASLKKSRKVNEDNIPILRPDELQNIFGNIEALYQKHVAFLAKLEEREKAWKEDEKEDRIGDVFYIGTQFFIMYSPYVLNYDKSLETVQALMAEKRFASHITLICGHPELKGLDLSNYLIMPVQRLPRYILLLTELVKATPRKHADYPALQRCLANVKAAAEVCNTRKELSSSGKRERIRKRSSTYSTLPQLSPKEDGESKSEKTPREKSPRKDKETSPRKDGESTPDSSKKTPSPASAPAKMQRSKSNQKMRHAGSAIVAGTKEEKASRRHTMARQTDGGELLFLLHREREKQQAAELMEKEMKNKEKQIPRITTKGEVSAFFVEPAGLPLTGNPTLNL